jgi:hypothetical protein
MFGVIADTVKFAPIVVGTEGGAVSTQASVKASVNIKVVNRIGDFMGVSFFTHRKSNDLSRHESSWSRGIRSIFLRD